MRNFRAWKTTLLGLATFVVAFYYLLKVEHAQSWIFAILLVFGTMMCFSADSLINSLTSFVKSNKDKKI
ncbi:MAG: hypothetical protein P1U29_04925 [Candidatus Pelagibacter bacterium]|jgi:type IV secretory pathway VirB2 component (pilin)|nr:hypothetical protein [Candidatus Pelagibacter bacterium]